MNYSARLLGQRFGLNAPEMNMALKQLGYLDGQPGKYTPTKKGKLFCNETYHDNGYGGYAKRTWATLSYDESIIGQLEQELTREVCQQAIDLVKERRVTKKLVEIAKQTAKPTETIPQKAENFKADFPSPLSPKNTTNFGIAVLVILGVAATTAAVTICVKKAKKKKVKKTLNAAKIIEMNQAKDTDNQKDVL